jgi:hypothetical protein
MMETQMEKLLSSLHARHIRGVYAGNREEANQKILALIPPDATVGIGDSTAMRQLGVLPALKERGTRILNPFEPKGDNVGVEDFRTRRAGVMREATLTDVFLTGSNAITQDGKIVNVDATGNRVAGMFWGHPLAIIVVGRNKIVRDLDEALNRIRTLIAPTHFRIRDELGARKRGTPCVATGECNDCRAEDRGCNVFTIIEGKPGSVNLHVFLINEDLGLGWDPSWPEERISKIRESYRKFVWIPV